MNTLRFLNQVQMRYFFRLSFLSKRKVAEKIDRIARLKDRVSTALDIIEGNQIPTPIMRLQLAETEKYLQNLNPKTMNLDVSFVRWRILFSFIGVFVGAFLIASLFQFSLNLRDSFQKLKWSDLAISSSLDSSNIEKIHQHLQNIVLPLLEKWSAEHPEDREVAELHESLRKLNEKLTLLADSANETKDILTSLNEILKNTPERIRRDFTEMDILPEQLRELEKLVNATISEQEIDTEYVRTPEINQTKTDSFFSENTMTPVYENEAETSSHRSESANKQIGMANGSNPVGETATRLDSEYERHSLAGQLGIGASEVERMATESPPSDLDASSFSDRLSNKATGSSALNDDSNNLVPVHHSVESAISPDSIPLKHRQMLRRYFESIGQSDL
ncbi:MAG: hypothetical protein ACRCUY_08180 [Thermoguttaceae bacterium]